MSIGLSDVLAPLGEFPILEDINLKGGYQVVSDTSARDAIPANKRKIGMQVYTVATAQLWVLYPDLTNSSWAISVSGAAVTSSAPVNVTKAAAAVGVATDAARADHKHDITTAAPTTGIGAANSEGSATTLARSDHSHALRTTTGPTDLAIGAITDGEFLKRVGATVVSAAVPTPSSAAPTIGIGSGNTQGVASTFALSDHNHTIRTGSTDLTVDTITDGQFLKRSGTTIISAAVSGGGVSARRTVTGPTTVTLATTDHFIMVDTTSGAVTLTLPTPVGTDAIYEIKDIAGTFGTNACTLARNAVGNYIEGLQASYVLEANFQNARLASDNVSKWWFL